MKTRSRMGHRRFQLKISSYANFYYIDRIADLERLLAKAPRTVQIDLIGEGEIPPDSALLIRSVLMTRSPKTRIITNARSSLQGGSVAVWLSGDSRIIRHDARLYFRRVDLDHDEAEPWVSNDGGMKYRDSFCEIDPEEGDYVRMLHVINEFLPVRELAGRFIGVPVLRQFGLVENEKVDHFLVTAFGGKEEPPSTPEEKRPRERAKKPRTRPARK